MGNTLVLAPGHVAGDVSDKRQGWSHTLIFHTGSQPNQSRKRCSRGRTSWKGRRLTGTCELSLLEPPNRPVLVLADWKSRAATLEFAFVVATRVGAG